jgi:hypothetical protein
MPTAIYRLKDGFRVPSVTTVNSIGKESGGLIHWAWNLGMEGRDYRKVRDDAAESGNVGHALVEAAITGKEPVFPTDGAAALGMQAFEAYKHWQSQSRIKWTDTELALVSEKYKFGGTIDAIGVEQGANTYCVGDWKTGGLYPEHLCQMAAYGRLFEEATGHAVGSYHLCRFNRDTGDFAHAYFQNLDDAWEAFLLKRRLYDLQAALKKRI